NGIKMDKTIRSNLQFSYIVQTNGSTISKNYMYERFGVTDVFGQIKPGIYYFKSLTEETVNKLSKNPNILKIKRDVGSINSPAESVFPYNSAYHNTMHQFGPIYIPEKGKNVTINLKVLPLYKRIIEEYEGNSLRVTGNDIYINEKKVKKYTFKQDYYWMMGDNRHNSIDSRFWGFVPFDHVIGKPVLTWFSWDKNAKGIKKIRWKRIFST